MKIAIVGAGIIGVTTAYELAADGHEVTVFERHGAAALETSFANAGQLSFGYACPWAAPGIPRKAIKWMFDEHPALTIRPDGTLTQIKWLLAMWRNCTADRYAINKERMVRLAEYSRHCMAELRAQSPYMSPQEFVAASIEVSNSASIGAFRLQAATSVASGTNKSMQSLLKNQ